MQSINKVIKMENSKALEIVKSAIGYSKKQDAGKNMKNAIQWLANLNGWSQETIYSQFVEFCLVGAERYKANNSYLLQDANDASNVALYIDFAASAEIEEMRAAK